MLVCGLCATADGSCFETGFKKWLGSKVQTVALSRKLPPVVDLAGAKIRIKVTQAKSVKDEAVDILATKLRAELLKDRARGVSLDDPNPDTELRCRVTSFEVTQQHQQKQVENNNNTYTVIIGNVEASVEVYDLKSGRALDSDNLKDHYERWVLTGSTPTSGKGIHVPLPGKKPKGTIEERVPTQSESVSAVLEGISRKVAQRLVPIDERIDVQLPKGFKDLESYAKAGNWGTLKEKAESMTPLPKAEEDSCRLYLVGLADEAIAYQEKDPKKAEDLLVSASSMYEKAKGENRADEYFNEPVNRTQESLERYLTLDKINTMARTLKSRENAAASRAAPAGTAAPAASAAYDNQYLIKLKKSGSSDAFIIGEIRDAEAPQFDASPKGMEQLGDAGFSDAVKTAVKEKMRKPSPARVNVPAKKK
jgi:hypothetical protein